ncbi:hypothetical protein ACQY0O_006886 [Thecaphora frezii]
MDVPLSSDALDVSFHPAADTHLLVTGLISGKIQLVDYRPLVDHTAEQALLKKSRPAKKKARRARSSSASEDDGDDDGDSHQVKKPGLQASKPTHGVADDGDVADVADGAAPKERQQPADKPKLYRKLWNTRPSAKSCRGLSFNTDGSGIFSLSKDKGIFYVDTETGKQKQAWLNAHDAAPSRILPIDEHLFVTGDDDGVVRLWDTRRPTKASASSSSSSSSSSSAAVRSYEHHFDWITDLLWCPYLEPPKQEKQDAATLAAAEAKRAKKMRKKRRKQLETGLDDDEIDAQRARADEAERESGRSRLVCTSGDGSLSVVDIRMGGSKAAEVSEDQEDELLSIAPVKGGSKLVVGTQLGMLSLWAPSRGLLDHVDRIPGHPASVDAVVALDYDTVLTGSSDGLVRVVQILPHKLLGIIADHQGLPVERLKRKDRWVASLGHGNECKVTDVGPLLEPDEDDEDGEGDSEDDEPLGIQGLADVGSDGDESSDDEEEEQGGDKNNEDEDEDDDDDSDSEDEDDSDEEGETNARLKNKAQWHIPAPGHEKVQKDRADFFADL